jgi:hypothetical protein
MLMSRIADIRINSNIWYPVFRQGPRQKAGNNPDQGKYSGLAGDYPGAGIRSQRRLRLLIKVVCKPYG